MGKIKDIVDIVSPEIQGSRDNTDITENNHVLAKYLRDIADMVEAKGDLIKDWKIQTPAIHGTAKAAYYIGELNIQINVDWLDIDYLPAETKKTLEIQNLTRFGKPVLSEMAKIISSEQGRQ